MRNPPRTIQDVLKLADDVESQLQIADSFKLELINSFHSMEVKEMSADETSGDEFEVNKMSRGKKWGNNNNYILITAIIAIITASPSTTSCKTKSKVDLGDKKVRTPK